MIVHSSLQKWSHNNQLLEQIVSFYYVILHVGKYCDEFMLIYAMNPTYHTIKYGSQFWSHWWSLISMAEHGTRISGNKVVSLDELSRPFFFIIMMVVIMHCIIISSNSSYKTWRSGEKGRKGMDGRKKGWRKGRQGNEKNKAVFIQIYLIKEYLEIHLKITMNFH